MSTDAPIPTADDAELGPTVYRCQVWKHFSARAENELVCSHDHGEGFSFRGRQYVQTANGNIIPRNDEWHTTRAAALHAAAGKIADIALVMAEQAKRLRDMAHVEERLAAAGGAPTEAPT